MKFQFFVISVAFVLSLIEFANIADQFCYISSEEDEADVEEV